MALRLEDIIEAQKRFAEKERQQANVERIPVEELINLQTRATIDADALKETSEKVLEAQQTVAKSVTSTDGTGLNSNINKVVDALQKNTDGISNLTNVVKKQSKDQSDALAGLASSTEISLSPLEKMTAFLGDIKEKFSLGNLRGSLLGGAAKMMKNVPLVGGMFQRAKEKEDWIKTQMKVDPSATRGQLNQDWQGFRKTRKDVIGASKEYEDTRKMLGMGEGTFAKTPIGKQLAEKQNMATTEFAKYERRASYVIGEGSNEPEETKPNVSRVNKSDDKQNPLVNPTKKNADATATAEKEQEAEKSFEEQTDLLKKIEENTNPDGTRAPTKVDSGNGLGGMLSKFGKGAVGAVGGIITTLLKGAGVLVLLGGALLVASVGFKSFADLDWETLGKAGAAITGLAIAAGTIGAFAGPIALGAAVIAGLGASVWVLGEGLQAVGESVNMFMDNIGRLGDVDGENLLKVGAGLAAVAAGMVAFGAANAVAGVTNLVGGFLGAITPGKTPVEQLLQIADAGPNIQMAGTGIQSFAEGLTKFSSVDKEKLSIIKDLPNDKIIALGSAIGKSAPATANVVYGASAENATVAAVGGGGTTNNVVAPTTVNNTTNQMGGYKPDVRNQDSSFKRMLDTRYVPV